MCFSCCFISRLPFSFVTDEVVQVTCQCLLEQASEAENVCLPPAFFIFMFSFKSEIVTVCKNVFQVEYGAIVLVNDGCASGRRAPFSIRQKWFLN